MAEGNVRHQVLAEMSPESILPTVLIQSNPFLLDWMDTSHTSDSVVGICPGRHLFTYFVDDSIHGTRPFFRVCLLFPISIPSHDKCSFDSVQYPMKTNKLPSKLLGMAYRLPHVQHFKIAHVFTTCAFSDFLMKHSPLRPGTLLVLERGHNLCLSHRVSYIYQFPYSARRYNGKS